MNGKKNERMLIFYSLPKFKYTIDPINTIAAKICK